MRYIQDYIVALSEREEGLALLQWITALKEIEGNEKANKLAKATIESAPIQEHLTNYPYSSSSSRNPPNPPDPPDTSIHSLIRSKLN